MKHLIFICIVLGLSLTLFAGSGISVIASSSSSPTKHLVSKPEVKVLLKGDKYFFAEKYLGKKGKYYLFIKNGKKVSIAASLVKEVKLTMQLEGKEKKSSTLEKTKQVRKTKKKELILTDYNVEKNFYLKDKNEDTEKKEVKKSSGLSVKVENQVIERKKDTITFKADIRNTTGLEVGKLSIILNIYDLNGKVVEKKKIFLANSLKDGKSIPFSYSIKDPEGKITRFDYSFEGIVYKPIKKEE